ncbi:MAG: tetratricopeptide repeat protein [Candidatus Omnitrophica bacterium]|nr:tetratricopeptide repeat protein [Candidatus Omnitrophota bacterium]
MALPVWLVVLALCALGAWLLWWLVGCATDDGSPMQAGSDRRFLRRVLLWSYGLRAVLGIALYLISYWGLPILPSLQFPSEPGFWVFGLDSHLYHHYGYLIAEAWKHGTELPVLELSPEYFAVVAVIYRLLGAHLLYPILLSCWLGAITGLLAFRIGRRLFSVRAARLGALLVSCWPSSMLWSAQLLKDSLSSFLVFSALALTLRLAFEERPIRRRGWHAMLLWTGLVVTIMLVTRLRFYLGSALSLTAVLILVPSGCALLMRRSRGPAIAAFGVALIVVASTVVARTLDPLAWVSPPHPEIGHRRLARSYWQQGNFKEASREFSRAIVLNKVDKPSYLGLAGLYAQQGRFDEALGVYASYVQVAEPDEQSLIRRTIGGLCVERADEALGHGRAAEAVANYERALAFDPAALSPFTYLGLTLLERGELELAAEFLEKARSLNSTAADQRRVGLIQERLAAKQHLLDEVARLTALRARFKEEEVRLIEAQKSFQAGRPDVGQPPATAAAPPATAAAPPATAEAQLRAEEAQLAEMLLTVRGTIQEGWRCAARGAHEGAERRDHGREANGV